MTTYQRPSGANWRRAGRGVVPTQAPWQGRKPGMVTGQQPQAAKPSILDKKLDPAQYPTLNTSPGVQKTNVGLPPLQGQVPGFDADVQKRRAAAFEAARKAREEKMRNDKVGRKADKRGQRFVDKVRDTAPGTFPGLLRDNDGKSAHHPLHKGAGTPNEPPTIDGKRNPNYVPPDNRQIHEGMYSPAWHHKQQNIIRAKQLQKGLDEGKIMRPGAVGPAGHTKGGNFRQPANQWAIGNVEIRTANALKAGFQPIMGQVRDGTGRMVQDIIGYEKIGDVQRREAMKAPPGEGREIHDDPQNNPFTQTPELPGIDNAGPDVGMTDPVGPKKPNLDMPGFNPEPYDVEDVPGGSVSAPSGGVDLAPPAFGPEEGGVNLNQDGGMVIPNLTGQADPSMDLPPQLDPESERSNAEIFGGTNRPQPPNEFTPVPQSPNSTGADDFTGPYTDEGYDVEGGSMNFDDTSAPEIGGGPETFPEVPAMPMTPDGTLGPLDTQEGGQNPYSPNYDPSSVAPAQGEVPNDMEGVGDKLREQELGDTGSFQPEHQVPPGVEFNDPKDRMSPLNFDDTSAPEIGGGPETFPEVPAMPMTPDGTLGPLPPIGSPEETDIANPQQDLSGNFPTTPPSSESPMRPNMEGAPELAFPPQSGPVINAGGANVNAPELPQAPQLPGTSLEDLPALPESEFPEYGVDDLGDIGQTELSPYEAPDPNIELEESPQRQALMSQITTIDKQISQTGNAAARQEMVAYRQTLYEQLTSGQ